MQQLLQQFQTIFHQFPWVKVKKLDLAYLHQVYNAVYMIFNSILDNKYANLIKEV